MAGLSLLVGALLTAVGNILGNFLFPNPGTLAPSSTALFVAVTFVSLVGTILLVLGAPGMLAAQRIEAGWLGFCGIILIVVAGTLFIGETVVNILVTPWLDAVAPTLAVDGPPGFFAYILTASLLLAVSGLLLGIATIRARVFSKWVGWLILIGTLLNLVSFLPLNDTLNAILFSVATLVLFAGIAGAGYALYSGSWQGTGSARTSG
jgi:hypothetical protein